MVTNTEDDEDSLEDPIDYKSQYRSLKRKLKFLIYENECFQEALRSNQRRMLKVTRDRSFLLDRLLNYEKVEASSSEGDDTESSDDELGRADAKRRKLDSNHFSNNVGGGTSSGSKAPTPAKKKKTGGGGGSSGGGGGGGGKVVKSSSQPQLASVESQTVEAEARRQLMDLDKTPLPVVGDVFSHDPVSLDSESNDLCDLDSSPPPGGAGAAPQDHLSQHSLHNHFVLPD